MMKGLCAIVVLFNPLISFIDVWYLYKRKGDKILRKGSLFQGIFEGGEGEFVCGPGGIEIVFKGIVECDCGRMDGVV